MPPNGVQVSLTGTFGDHIHPLPDHHFPQHDGKRQEKRLRHNGGRLLRVVLRLFSQPAATSGSSFFRQEGSIFGKVHSPPEHLSLKKRLSPMGISTLFAYPCFAPLLLASLRHLFLPFFLSRLAPRFLLLFAFPCLLLPHSSPLVSLRPSDLFPYLSASGSVFRARRSVFLTIRPRRLPRREINNTLRDVLRWPTTMHWPPTMLRYGRNGASTTPRPASPGQSYSKGRHRMPYGHRPPV